MNRKLGVPACATLIAIAVAGCSSSARKPTPPPTPAATTPQRPGQPATAVQGAYGSAQRIVGVARREHMAWYQPFIDSNGRLASVSVTEAEQSRLADGTEAWRRVLDYWRGSGTLYEMADSHVAGTSYCMSSAGFAQGKAECRAFLIDNPWSAAFVSYVMMQARVPAFRASPRHYDYILQAYRGESGAPFLYTDPATHKPAPGDLLCFVRGNSNSSAPGYGGLTSWLGNGSGRALQTHCDIVVGRNGDRELLLIGGNVFNTVTLRKLKLDSRGYPILPREVVASYADDESGAVGADCSPYNESACDFNRQNWAVLLKLKPTLAYPAQVTGSAAPRYVTPQGRALQPASSTPAAPTTAAPRYVTPQGRVLQPASPVPATPATPSPAPVYVTPGGRVLKPAPSVPATPATTTPAPVYVTPQGRVLQPATQATPATAPSPTPAPAAPEPQPATPP